MLRCAVRKPDASMWGEGGQEEFVLLLADLGVRGIVAGSNYRFGYKAAGDAALLQELGLKHGLVVDIVDIVMSSDVMHGQMKRVRARGEPPPTHSGSLRPFSRQELPLNTRSTCGSPLCTAAARAAASDGCRSPLVLTQPFERKFFAAGGGGAFTRDDFHWHASAGELLKVPAAGVVHAHPRVPGAGRRGRGGGATGATPPRGVRAAGVSERLFDSTWFGVSNFCF
jgi:hypothetical protein